MGWKRGNNLFRGPGVNCPHAGRVAFFSFNQHPDDHILRDANESSMSTGGCSPAPLLCTLSLPILPLPPGGCVAPGHLDCCPLGPGCLPLAHASAGSSRNSFSLQAYPVGCFFPLLSSFVKFLFWGVKINLLWLKR